MVAFGQFLPKEIREAPARGYLINGHASLLPRYRGAAPISRCILDGATVTGISAMRVEREMDSGAIALQREIEIGEHENAGDLSERLAKLTADTLEEVIEQIADDRVSWVPQDDTRVTFAPKIRRSDAELIWTESAEALCRRVRAMAPSPGAFAIFEGENLQITRCALGYDPDRPRTGNCLRRTCTRTAGRDGRRMVAAAHPAATWKTSPGCRGVHARKSRSPTAFGSAETLPTSSLSSAIPIAFHRQT